MEYFAVMLVLLIVLAPIIMSIVALSATGSVRLKLEALERRVAALSAGTAQPTPSQPTPALATPASTPRPAPTQAQPALTPAPRRSSPTAGARPHFGTARFRSRARHRRQMA